MTDKFYSQNILRDDCELKMYTIVLRSLSPIQKGIQALHSIIEYSNYFGNTDIYQKWSKEDKTEIILDGGSSFTFQDDIMALKEIGINFSTFEEADLYGIETAVSFIVPSTIYGINSMNMDFFEMMFTYGITDEDEVRKYFKLYNIIKSKHTAR